MATGYQSDQSSMEDNTFFDDNSRLTTVFSRQRAYDLRHSLGRDGGEQNFPGFQLDERPMRPLSVLTPNYNRMVVSDSRNDLNFTGDTRISQPVNNEQERSQFATAPIRNGVANIELPLSSTGRSRIPHIQNTNMGSPIMNNSVPQDQMGWSREMIRNPARRNRNFEAQFNLNRPVTNNGNSDVRNRNNSEYFNLPRPTTNAENKNNQNNLNSERLESRTQNLKSHKRNGNTNLGTTDNHEINKKTVIHFEIL